MLSCSMLRSLLLLGDVVFCACGCVWVVMGFVGLGVLCARVGVVAVVFGIGGWRVEWLSG